MSDRRNVLFVCTGNICRSPTAEGVFRRKVRDSGLESRVDCDSAGVSGFHQGESPDTRSAAHARKRGYVLEALRARQVIPDDFARFDLILAMDRTHLRALKQLAPPQALHKVQLFLDYAPDTGLHDVPDPYYGGSRGFEEVLDLVEAGCDGLIRAMKESETGAQN